MSATLPLDKEAALRKMLTPSWQKKRTGDKASPVAPKPRTQVEIKCIECGKPRMINKGNTAPLRCKACAGNRGWGRKA